MKRRHFLKSTAIVSIAAPFTRQRTASAQSRSANRKMTINLVCGAIGVKASQTRAIDLAAKHGFESVEAHSSYLAELSDGELEALKTDLKKKKLVWGTSGLSVDFRKNEDTFRKGLKELPRLAAGLQRAGVRCVNTWIMPCHDELTYLENFKQHSNRLRKICRVLEDYDLRIGLEYVGTATLLAARKYPFLHTMAEALELVDTIGTGNAGIVLDSWHWWQAGDSIADIERLNKQDIILVDLNDAPAGIEKKLQLDGKRELPLATGTIDAKGFLNALVKIGYDGPVRAEPFNQSLRDLEDDPACKATVDSLKKAFKLIG
tara:strand:- start:53 stop:1006 length:954 start_codon:yes stop_codon:yes gene_type:complete